MLKKGWTRSLNGGVPLYLNIYDLTPLNGYMYWLGLGIYHSAIEAYGVEYAFGAHDFPSTGVFEVEPRSCPGFTFRKAILLGTVNLGPKEFRKLIMGIASEYHGDSYHLIAKNCNHFCDTVCMRLVGHSIPLWVNRLARLGSVCNCLLPDSLHVTTTVRHALGGSEDQANKGEEISSHRIYRRLIGSFAPMAIRKRSHSVASMLLLSSFKRGGGVMPRDSRNLKIVKERLQRNS